MSSVKRRRPANLSRSGRRSGPSNTPYRNDGFAVSNGLRDYEPQLKEFEELICSGSDDASQVEALLLRLIDSTGPATFEVTTRCQIR